MTLLATLHRSTERVAHALALVGLAGLLVLSLLVVADISLRALVDYPLQGVNDVYAVLMAVVIAACMPNALLTKQNIAIEVLGETLGGRLRIGLDCFASAATLLFFVLLTWRFVPYAESITASERRSRTNRAVRANASRSRPFRNRRSMPWALQCSRATGGYSAPKPTYLGT